MKKPALKHTIVFLVFCIVTCLIYSNTLNSPFVFDDIENILDNSRIRTQGNFPGPDLFSNFATRPVAMYTFALNHFLHGYSLPGYHIVNILIHIINGLLLFFLFRQTLRFGGKGDTESDYMALAAALIWVVHPVQTQSVTYIVQRMTSLATMFYIGAILAYIKGRTAESLKKSSLFFLISVIAFLLAIGSKQNAITLPVVILLYEWFFFRDLRSDWLKKHSLPILAGAVVFGFLLYLFVTHFYIDFLTQEYARYNFNMPQRLLTELRVVLYYISLLIYPNPGRLNIDYMFPVSTSFVDPVTTLLSFFCITGLILVALFRAKQNRLIAFSIFWFFGNLVIESSFIPLDLIFEHRLYLPAIFPILAAVVALWQVVQNNKIRTPVVAIIVVFLCIWTYQRNRAWESEFTLWADSAEKAPNNPRAHNNLGLAYKNMKQWDKAIFHYKKSLSLNPHNSEALSNLGVSLFHTGKKAAALKRIKESLSLNPKNHVAINNWGNILRDRGELNAALKKYRHALSMRKDYNDARINISAVEQEKATISKNIKSLKSQLEIKPDDPVLAYKLGLYLEKNEEPQNAFNWFKTAADSEVPFPKAIIKTAGIYIKNEDYPNAIDAFKKLHRLNPDNNKICYNISCLYGKSGDKENTLKWLRMAIRKGYDNISNIRNDSDLKLIKDTDFFRQIIQEDV